MNKTLLLLVYFTVASCGFITGKAQAQVKPVEAQYSNPNERLVNGGFEQGKRAWALGAGNYDVLGTSVYKGNRHARITLTNQTLDFSQTFSIINEKGNIYTSCKISTTISGVFVGALKDGSVGAERLVDNSGNYSQEVVKDAYGTTSSGIKIFTNAPVTGVVDIDDCTFHDQPASASPNVAVAATINAQSKWSTPEVTVLNATTTAPGKGTTDVDEIKYRRNGSNARVRMTFQQAAGGAGTAGAGDYLIKMPAGLKIDLSKVRSSNTVWGRTSDVRLPERVGSCSLQWQNPPTGSSALQGGVYVYDEDHLRCYGQYNRDTTTTAAGAWGSTFYDLGSANAGGKSMNFDFEVPIQGWSDGYDVATGQLDPVYIEARRSTVQAIGAATTFIFDTVIENNAGTAYDNTTGIFTSPVDTVYNVCANMLFDTTSWALGNVYESRLQKNTADVYYLTRETIVTTTNNYYDTGGCENIKMKKGDTLRMDVFQNSGGSRQSIASANFNVLTISEDPGRRTVVADIEGINDTPIVKVKGRGTAGGTITANTTPINWTETEDNSDAWDGSVFTAPKTSSYEFTGNYYIPAGPSMLTLLYKDTGSGYGDAEICGEYSNLDIKSFSCEINLTAGTKVQVRTHSGGGTLQTAAQWNNLSITEQPSLTAIVENLNKDNNVKCQTKNLINDYTTADTAIPDLLFNNLKIGRTYMIKGRAQLTSPAGGGFTLYGYNSTNGTNGVSRNRYFLSGTIFNAHQSLSEVFKASATTLEFRVPSSDISGAWRLEGEQFGNAWNTSITLCEMSKNWTWTTEFN